MQQQSPTVYPIEIWREIAALNLTEQEVAEVRALYDNLRPYVHGTRRQKHDTPRPILGDLRRSEWTMMSTAEREARTVRYAAHLIRYGHSRRVPRARTYGGAA